MPITLKNPNSLPQNVLNFSVKFTTTNLDSGTVFSEPFIVTGPSGSFNNALNYTTNGSNKIFIPLTTNTTNGANYLKIWLPQPNSDKIYITFAKKASSMADGYYDYVSGIPTAYRTDLRNWILDGNTIQTNQPPLKKTLIFGAIGKNTNQVQESIEFRIQLSGIFSSTASSQSQTS